MNFNAISPLDGRYGAILEPLRLYMSDFALTKYRIQIEVEWLIFLSECPEIEELPSFSKRERQLIYKSRRLA